MCTQFFMMSLEVFRIHKKEINRPLCRYERRAYNINSNQGEMLNAL